MASNAVFAEIAALAGDPARAGMLHSLMDGRALTASELARAGGITPQTASSHLAKLVAAGLLAVETQGRHRYHRLASPAVARMMESIMEVASDAVSGRRPIVVGPRDAALLTARTCYDHLAGRLGVALADALVAGGHMELGSDAGLLTDSGMALLGDIGMDVEDIFARRGRGGPLRPLLRQGLDPPQRRHPRGRDHAEGTAGVSRGVRRNDRLRR